MIDQREITEGRVIAIWLGDFNTFDLLDDYMMNSFERDYGFTINDRAGPEISEPDGKEMQIRELLTGFSFWEDWIDDAVQLCEAAGWKSTRSAVIFHHLRYSQNLCTNPNAALKFVTNVPWNTKE